MISLDLEILYQDLFQLSFSECITTHSEGLEGEQFGSILSIKL